MVEAADYTKEERIKMLGAIRAFRRTGKVMEARALEEKMSRREEILPEDLNVTGTKPEKGVESPDDLTPPPREGNQATRKAWRTFAARVTDMEMDVLKNMSRGEIIDTLEAQGVIPSA